ncbi:hypothetical protein ANCCAN_20191 [Ancylostoma caninum]|uniref:Uncharacterized protein n=1 Tax=Ancylostoma caninum TaxID=29170 RepID=A0A368FP69_ANCCA|nr:hypothetical protein ANCCAN_20191 [Ancylostoma caninum]
MKMVTLSKGWMRMRVVMRMTAEMRITSQVENRSRKPNQQQVHRGDVDEVQAPALHLAEVLKEVEASSNIAHPMSLIVYYLFVFAIVKFSMCSDFLIVTYPD